MLIVLPVRDIFAALHRCDRNNPFIVNERLSLEVLVLRLCTCAFNQYLEDRQSAT